MNFFNQVKDSVIDFKFYRNIKDNRFAKTFLYLLLLLLVIHSMITARDFLLVKNVMERASYELSANIPDFQMKDGKFRFEGKMPYYITSSTNELFVIDTTGTVGPDVLKDVIAGVLVTEDTVYLKNNLQSQSINLADFKGLEFNKQSVINFIPKLSWMVLIVMMVGFIFVLGWKLLNAVLLALLGILINSTYKTDLKYKQLFNFSVYALTLPMLIKLAVDIAGYPIPFFSIIYWSISLVYMSFAIKTYKESESQADDGDDASLV